MMIMPTKNAPPTLNVEGFFSTILATILDAGMQKAKTVMTMVNMMAIGISRDLKRTKIRAVAKP